MRGSRIYVLPVADTTFLLRDEMRDIRFALEYAKAELLLRDWGIRSTIVVFGSARTPSPQMVEAARAAARDDEAARGAPSIGFNIALPSEQEPNPYTTPELTFRFHYFAMRKMHLAMRANALVVFPGGFGTFDELFEILNLVQTGKARRIPIVLFRAAYWHKVVNFAALAKQDMVSEATAHAPP